MEKFTDCFKRVVEDRVAQIADNVSTQNVIWQEKFKQCVELNQKIINKGASNIEINAHDELMNLLQNILLMEVYAQGFRDGIDFKNTDREEEKCGIEYLL